jgi:hypothetical protein
MLAARGVAPQGPVRSSSMSTAQTSERQSSSSSEPASGSSYLKPPNSRNSYRTLALSTLVLDALAAHIASCGPGENGLVFHADGRPIGRSMASKHIRLAARAVGLEGRTWTCATIMRRCCSRTV